MIKIIHTGDLHIGSRFKNANFDEIQRKNRRLEIWKTFKRIIYRAQNKSPNFLLIAGDLFEEDFLSLGGIKRIRDSFSSLTDTEVVVSAGNHDTLNTSSLYKSIEWPKNVHIFGTSDIEKFIFKSLNTVIWGFSWEKKEYKSSDFLNFDGLNLNMINILLIHGDVNSSDSSYLSLDKNRLEKLGFDYIALGHIHKPQIVSKNIYYCGSPEPLNFGETGTHGIIEGTVEKGKCNVNLLDFSKRKFIIKDLKTNSLMTYDDILKLIINCDTQENRLKNLYRVVLEGIVDRDIELDVKYLESELADAFYYLEIIDNTVLDYDLDRLKKDNKNNIIGNFIEEMENKNLEDPIVKEALYIGLEVLLKEKAI